MVFYGCALIGLGLMIVFVEIDFMKHRILREFGLLKHYLGRGSYVFFISLLSFNPYQLDDSGSRGFVNDVWKSTSVVGFIAAII